MNTSALRQFATADESCTIHIKLPPGFCQRVEVIVLPAPGPGAAMSEESLDQIRLVDESGFVARVLNHPDEECWNEL